MGNIVLLDDLTINKIAAGEVIERPASVVKEMVENSIDAEAKNITIEIKNGGISLIRIIDDGKGIRADDMEIAFERHATSKIRSANDLSSIKTMGFRGEALASVAAISKIEMISKTKDEDIGNKIVVEGGKVLEQSECGASNGTKISVENLFYNTPVRYKFLKKDYTETGYIEEQVKKLALYNTDIAFKLISNGKTILQTNGNGDLKTAIYSIFGKDTAQEVVDVDYTYEDIKVTGVVGNPVLARGNRANQIFFVNGRSIKDKNLTAATEQAYKGIVPVGRYPFLVLNLEMDMSMVDVNVHPAKLEVRFTDESMVFKAVYHAIKTSLMNSDIMSTPKMEDTSNVSIFQNQESSITDHAKNGSDILSSAYSSEENNESADSAEEVEEVDKEKKKGLFGLFKKLAKDDEDDDEEDEEFEHNSLAEIYKSRREGNKSDFSREYKNDEVEIKPSFNSYDAKTEETPVVNLEENVEEKVEPTIEEKEEVAPVEYKEEIKEEPKVVDPNQALIDKVFGNIGKEEVKEKPKEEPKEEPVEENLEGSPISGNIKTINDSNISKEIKMDNTVISSDTREISVTEVTEALLEKTKEIIANLDNTSETRLIDSNLVKEEMKSEAPVNTNISDATAEVVVVDKDKKFESTQVVNIKDALKEENANQDTVILSEEDRQNLPQDTVEVTEKAPEETTEVKTEETPKKEFNPENVKDTVTEALIKAKLNLDNTQMIDTSKIRDELGNKEILSSPEFEKMYKEIFGADTVEVRREQEKIRAAKEQEKIINDAQYVNENIFEGEEDEVPEVKYKYVGAAFDRYILIEIKDEVYFIDKNAANERILFEQLKDNYYNDGDRNVQQLLMPDLVECDRKDIEVSRENLDILNDAGFYFEEFGDNAIKLTSVPGICEQLNTKALFKDILTVFDTVAVIDTDAKVDKLLSTIARQVAENEDISLEDVIVVNKLLNDLFMLENPFLGIEKNPIAIKMGRADLERKFNRR